MGRGWGNAVCRRKLTSSQSILHKPRLLQSCPHMVLHHNLATCTLGRLQPVPPASGNRPGMSRSSGDLLLELGLGFCDVLEIAAILHLVSGICGVCGMVGLNKPGHWSSFLLSLSKVRVSISYGIVNRVQPCQSGARDNQASPCSISPSQIRSKRQDEQVN